MKKINIIVVIISSLICLVCLYRSKAAEPSAFQSVEFATIRWSGRENTHLIRPNGKIERLRLLLEKYPRPDGFDDRAFYMNVAMNALAAEGYEFAGMTSDEIVMKRPIPKQ